MPRRKPLPYIDTENDSNNIPVQIIADRQGNQILKNPRHEEFCKKYIEYDRNANKAYEEVYGVKDINSNVVAASCSRLLKDVNIQARIVALNAQFVVRHLISRDNVLAGFWDVYQRCTDAVPVTDKFGNLITQTIKDDKGKPVQVVCRWQFDSKGAIGALQNIGRYLGLFNADTTTNSNVNVSVEVSAARDFISSEMERLHKLRAINVDSD